MYEEFYKGIGVKKISEEGYSRYDGTNLVYTYPRVYFLFEGLEFKEEKDLIKYLKQLKKIEEYKDYNIYRQLMFGRIFYYAYQNKLFHGNNNASHFRNINELKNEINCEIDKQCFKDFVDEAFGKMGIVKDERMTDNLLAIDMSNSVNNILYSIEINNSDEIQTNLKHLKNKIAEFEEVFYENKNRGLYK